MRFEWDDQKEAANRKKHAIGFEEATTAFYDDYALVLEDPEHSDSAEERFLLVGASAALRVLVVCHCLRRPDDVIRIISARKATARERELYTQRWMK